MRSRLLVSSLLVSVSCAAFAGCFAETGSFNGADPNGNGDDDSGTPSNPDGAPALDDAGKPMATGVPCEIETILSKYCWSCHGVSPTAPSRLVTYSDLTAPSVNDKSKSEAVEALMRMQSTTSPMPSSGPKPTASELQTFSTWVNAQTPKGAKCGGSSSDAGTLPEDAAPPQNPYNTPVQCTSNKKWTSGNGGSMRPGDNCLRCHNNLSIAGTVYPSAHEPLNCLGIAGGSTVVVTDAKNKTVNLTVNSSGNFYYQTSFFNPALTPPYVVKVISGSKTRTMTAKATSGDCNSCHTQNGTQNAPGRIMAP